MRGRNADDIPEEGADMAQIVTATAKKVLISQVVKRNVMENIVPVVISLKHMVTKEIFLVSTLHYSLILFFKQ